LAGPGQSPGLAFLGSVITNGGWYYFALNSTAIVVGGRGHLIGDNIIETGLDAGSDIVIAGRDNLIRGNQVRSTAAVSIRETASADGNLIDGNLVHGTIAKAGAASVITLTNYNTAPGSGVLTPIRQPPLVAAPGYTPQAAGQAITAAAQSAATETVWSTVVGFGAGDGATVWGITPVSFDIFWIDNEGTDGFTGLTMYAKAPGKADILLTLAGVTEVERTSGRLSVIYGNDQASGSDYMHVFL